MPIHTTSSFALSHLGFNTLELTNYYTSPLFTLRILQRNYLPGNLCENFLRYRAISDSVQTAKVEEESW
jgi:hypothetical protein